MAISTTRKARYDVLLPRLNRAGEGVAFEPGNYVRRQGTIPAQLQAVRLTGSPLGVHATGKGGDKSLCNCPLTPNGKAQAEVKATGQAAKVATVVTCKFCLARLVNAGLFSIDALSDGMPDASKAYAADYGTRDAEAELAKLSTNGNTSK